MARTGRVSREQSELNRNSIIATSSQLFRDRGLDGVSLKDIMSAAGLTHGGFYGHFSSKEELEAIACKKAFEDSHASLDERGIKNFSQLVDYYLSPPHRDCPASGCAVAALVTDVQRKGEDTAVSQAFLAGLKNMTEQFRSLKNGPDDAPEKDEYLAQFSMMVGALMLARATRGDELSARLLASAKSALLEKTSD